MNSEIQFIYIGKKDTTLDSDRLSLDLESATNPIHKADRHVVFYKAYLWVARIENNSEKSKFSKAMKFLNLFLVSCPFLWCVISLFINLYECITWLFTYPSMLWVVYGISIGSVALDYIINMRIIYILDNKIILNNIVGDFVCIWLILAGFLFPMIFKGSTQPDDEFNSTFTQMSTNLLDSCSIIAITVGNIVLNKLTESTIQTSIINKTVYLEHLFDNKVYDTDPRIRDAKNAVKDALTRVANKNVTVHDITIEKENFLKVIDLLDRTIDEFDNTTKAGKFRFLLRLKMMLNLFSTVLYVFYSNVYLSGPNGCYVFLLFLTVLNFLNNLTSATCIKSHDDMVVKVYANNTFNINLSVGKYNGFDHVQFYSTLIFTLANLIFRLSVTKALV